MFHCIPAHFFVDHKSNEAKVCQIVVQWLGQPDGIRRKHLKLSFHDYHNSGSYIDSDSAPISARKKIEHNLELFLLITGIATVTLSHFFGPEPLLSLRLAASAVLEPVKLTLATLAFGLVFRAMRSLLKKKIVALEIWLGPRKFAFLLIFILGLISSMITAIIASLILCEVVTAINLDKKYETRLVVFACFSIGMGAALTPIGEPLSAIAIAKLRDGALGGDFLMLLHILGIYILPGLLLVSFAGGFLRGSQVARSDSLVEDFAEPFSSTALRAFKLYIFVMALVLLGRGFKPLIDLHISQMPAPVLYSVNCPRQSSTTPRLPQRS